MKLPRSSSSIVVRTAVLTSLICATILGLAFVLLYSTQREIYRERLVEDVKESISHISIFTLGYFYSQNNWIHLEETQRQLNLTPNILYSYTVNAQNAIDLGVDGVSSRDLGKSGEPWEPKIPFDTKNIIQNEFVASPELVKRFPQRLKAGDPVVLVGIPLYCMAIGEKCAQLRVGIIYESLRTTLDRLQWHLTVILVLLTLVVAIVIFYWTRRSLSPIRFLAKELHEVAMLDATKRKEVAAALNRRLDKIANTRDETEETVLLRDSLRQFVASMERASELENELAVSTSLSELAAQVAHDIRSPLTALNLICDDLDALPETQRELLKRAVMRIRDIANTLPTRSQEKKTNAVTEKHFSPNLLEEPELTASVIDTLISEKRVQYRQQTAIAITYEFHPSAYSAFAKIESSDLKRILSNLIDNAVEAIPEAGRVFIHVNVPNDRVEITIADNGKGIPSEVQMKLMVKGATFGKTSGSGLGLFHAKSILTLLGGSISLKSVEHEGTTVTLSIPRIDPPSWFTATISLDGRHHIVVVDDDLSIHGVWAKKFQTAGHALQGVEIEYLASGKALTDWVAQDAARTADTLFLVDFEFVGDERSGIDYVNELNLAKRSILVTSRFEELSVRQECILYEIPLIPKNLATLFPIV